MNLNIKSIKESIKHFCMEYAILLLILGFLTMGIYIGFLFLILGIYGFRSIELHNKSNNTIYQDSFSSKKWVQKLYTLTRIDFYTTLFFGTIFIQSLPIVLIIFWSGYSEKENIAGAVVALAVILIVFLVTYVYNFKLIYHYENKTLDTKNKYLLILYVLLHLSLWVLYLLFVV